MTAKLAVLSLIIKVEKRKGIKSHLMPHVDKLALLGYNGVFVKREEN